MLDEWLVLLEKLRMQVNAGITRTYAYQAENHYFPSPNMKITGNLHGTVPSKRTSISLGGSWVALLFMPTILEKPDTFGSLLPRLDHLKSIVRRYFSSEKKA